jgi:hypothetical protein
VFGRSPVDDVPLDGTAVPGWATVFDLSVKIGFCGFTGGEEPEGVGVETDGVNVEMGIVVGGVNGGPVVIPCVDVSTPVVG